MATVDIPDELWEFLQGQAQRHGRDPADLVTRLLDNYRTQQTTNRSKTLAPKGYGLRPEERKQRSR
jgi:negative regulator of replication initiation